MVMAVDPRQGKDPGFSPWSTMDRVSGDGGKDKGIRKERER